MLITAFVVAAVSCGCEGLMQLQHRPSDVSEDARSISAGQRQQQRCKGFCNKSPAVCFRSPVTDGEQAAVFRHRRAEPPTIPWDSFVKILTFNATKKVVKADPKQRRNKRLSPHQVEDIVQEYLEHFERFSEEGKARERKTKKDAAKKRPHARSRSRKSDFSQEESADRGDTAEGMVVAATISPQKDPPQLRHAVMTATETEEDQQLLSRTPTDKSTTVREHDSKSSRDMPAVQGFQECSITITGEALTHALSSAENRRYFYGLASLCNTLIACRVSPKQKAEVVHYCQRYQSNTVSLGIGDGANDVGMLISANVGVGIRGKEGLQAVRAADFSITEFKYLKNLLFCHGAEALRRNSFQIYQTIWKNVVFGVADFFYAFVSAWSASDIFNSWLKQLFNVLYTTLPVVLYSIFDRQLPMEVTLQTPVLYPAYATCCCVFVPLYGLGWGIGNSQSEGHLSLSVRFQGTVVFWTIIMVCNLIVIPYLHTWFWFIWLAVFLDFGFWFLSVGICPIVPGDYCPDLYGALRATHSLSRFYFSVFLAVVVALMPPFINWFYVTMFRPSAQCIIRERIAMGVFDVVVAPRGGPKTVVVVPKTGSEETARVWGITAFLCCATLLMQVFYPDWMGNAPHRATVGVRFIRSLQGSVVAAAAPPLCFPPIDDLCQHLLQRWEAVASEWARAAFLFCRAVSSAAFVEVLLRCTLASCSNKEYRVPRFQQGARGSWQGGAVEAYVLLSSPHRSIRAGRSRNGNNPPGNSSASDALRITAHVAALLC
ncbi:putative P-type ATPase [Cyclospora cayetanensis]|uniref:P-type ATPase n=1 Tax=Cyclospora cayetanensis TaxID=88456 RepID=A0A1D3D121_9EIME|nr:putative P-type ATPase [Cyclospora cayetanensis]